MAVHDHPEEMSPAYFQAGKTHWQVLVSPRVTSGQRFEELGIRGCKGKENQNKNSAGACKPIMYAMSTQQQVSNLSSPLSL